MSTSSAPAPSGNYGNKQVHIVTSYVQLCRADYENFTVTNTEGLQQLNKCCNLRIAEFIMDSDLIPRAGK